MTKSKIIFIAVLMAVSFSGCSKKAYAQGSVSEAPVQIIEKSPEEIAWENNCLRFDKVFASMSSRFRDEVQIVDKKAFFADLEKVLLDEKTYTQDDLPLFYLIDKKHNVGKDYEPKVVKLTDKTNYNFSRNDLSLRPDVEENLSVMGRAAKNDGITLLVSSTYRSYAYQDRLFQYWVDVDGLEEAERESARPGTSQHQLGVAVDFGSIDDSFAETKMGRWMYQNAADYGWSLSFPKNYEDITGYRWESWHFRYIGVPACRLQKKYFCDVQQYMLEFIDAWKNSQGE